MPGCSAGGCESSSSGLCDIETRASGIGISWGEGKGGGQGGDEADKDDAGVGQVAILELGKDIVRETLPVLKARSGVEIVYQDEEAEKSANQ